MTILTNAATLPLNLFTGVVVARALDATGRGSLAAIVTLVHVAGFFGASGARTAVAYMTARSQDTVATIARTWAVIWVGLTLATTAAIELVVSSFFSAQAGQTVLDARIYAPAAGLIIAAEISSGILSGLHRFKRWNAFRVAQPLILALAYATLAATGN